MHSVDCALRVAAPDALHQSIFPLNGDGLTATTEANLAFAICGTVIVPVLPVIRTFTDVNADAARSFNTDLRTGGYRGK
jgi:hypothetical protein